MDKYFIVFRIALMNKACKRGLCSLCDVYDSRKIVRGFQTKRKMQEFADEYKEQMLYFMMLKPVS